MNIESSIATIEIWTGCPLPTAYAGVLADCGGKIYRDHVLIYSVDDVVERNETFQTKINSPEYFAIGDDSGGKAVLVRLDGSISSVFAVDHGSMDPEDFETVGAELRKWIADDCPM